MQRNMNCVFNVSRSNIDAFRRSAFLPNLWHEINLFPVVSKSIKFVSSYLFIKSMSIAGSKSGLTTESCGSGPEFELQRTRDPPLGGLLDPPKFCLIQSSGIESLNLGGFLTCSRRHPRCLTTPSSATQKSGSFFLYCLHRSNLLPQNVENILYIF